MRIAQVTIILLLSVVSPDAAFGFRVDYRFIPVASKDDAPAFLGREPRYGDRIAGGLVINLSR